MGAAPLDRRERALRDAVLTWYRDSARALPWRATRDPWRLLVSEVMLQQTQASRVAPVWERFCARFPTPHALADASPADVLREWGGLGYNRRAVFLHRAATRIVDAHGGHVPADLGGLRSLPGVGEYTARAVLAFAHGADAAPVDTNVSRVLARAVAGAPLRGRRLQALADRMVPAGRAADWGQALMDLGARVCTAAAPRCGGCPVAAACAWRRAGGDDPARPAAEPARSRAAAFAGSDRYHRGRLVEALRASSIDRGRLPAAADLVDDLARAEVVAAGLVSDGLAEWTGDRLRLPGRGAPAHRSA